MAMVIVYILIVLAIIVVRQYRTFELIPLLVLLSTFIYPFITDANTDIHILSNSATFLLKSFIMVTLFFLSLLIIIKSRKKNLILFKIVAVIGLYLFSLSLLSWDIPSSAFRVLNVITFLMLLLSSFSYYSELKKEEYFENFLMLLFATNSIAVAYIFYASAYKVGANIYGNEYISFGGFHLFGLYFFIFSLPFFLFKIQSSKKKFIYYLLLFLEFAIILISLKRTFLIFAVIIYSLYFIIYLRKNSVKLIVIIFASTVIFSYNTFKTELEILFETRQKKYEKALTDEGRYLEYLIFFEERVQNISVESFIGSNIFNNYGLFGKGNSYGLNTNDRSLHSDFMEILYGAGFIGFFLFSYFFSKLFFLYVNIKKKLNKIASRDFTFLFLATYIMLLFSHSIDGIFIFWARGFAYLCIGLILAYYKNRMRNTASVLPIRE